MQGRCDKHLFEGAEDRCGRCGYEFCGECLVYSFGPKKPPFCIPCAVAAAGIRSNAGHRPMADTRELKQLKKERRSAFRRLRREDVCPEATMDAPPEMPVASALNGPVMPVQF
jgi:hypothetical protein